MADVHDERHDDGAPEVRSGTSAVPPPVDLARLAEKVYALLRSELRLERARAGRSGRV